MPLVLRDCFVAGGVGMVGAEMIRDSCDLPALYCCVGTPFPFRVFFSTFSPKESDSCGENSSLSTHFSFRVENSFEWEMKDFLFATKAVDF